MGMCAKARRNGAAYVTRTRDPIITNSVIMRLRGLSGPPRCGADRALEAESDEIKAADEFIDDTNQSIRGNVVIDARWQ